MEITTEIDGALSKKFWIASTELRWAKREILFDMLNTVKVLQQKFEEYNGLTYTGKFEWRDVPVVEEE